MREKIKSVEKVSNQVVKRDNRLVEARYDMTTTEYKLLLFVLSFLEEADLSDDGFPVFKVPVSLFLEQLGSPENYTHIKEVVDNLMKRVVTFEHIGEDGLKEFVKYPLVSRARYKQKASYIEIQIHKDLLPFFLHLKEKYTNIPLKNIFMLNSKYAIRIYELAKQYQNTGYRKESVERLRFLLGIEKDEYTIWNNFENRVIKRGVEEISEKTDLIVSYRKVKTGGKITDVEFIIKPKTDFENNNIEEKLWKMYRLYEARREIQEDITDINKNKITENQILFLYLNSKNKALVIDTIKTITKRKNVKNPFGLLVKVLNIDLQTAEYKELLNTSEEIEELFLYELTEKCESGSDIIRKVIASIDDKNLSKFSPYFAFKVDKTIFMYCSDKKDRIFLSYIRNFESEISDLLAKKGYKFLIFD